MLHPMKTKSLIPLSVAALAALLCASTPGVASIMLSTEQFTLLGGTAITNEGSTIIDGGNVGISPEGNDAITGFAAQDGGPGVIENPYGIEQDPIVTAQARQDLIKLQAGLHAMTSVPLDDSWGGMTLEPGVYSFAAAANLNGVLTLDGMLQNNAFWVFNFSAALTTAAGVSVEFTNLGSNGGSDYGIFWNAGTITTGANNVLVGNYLAETAVTFGANSNGSARALALEAVTLDTNTVDAFGGPGNHDWSGGLMYNQSGDIVPIPEPAIYVTIFGLAIFGMVIVRRIRGNREA
jgi:hypothetical protein